MALHVDIFSNEPLANERRLLARLIMNGGPHLEMRLATEKTDERRMWSYLRSRVSIDPDRDPDCFLRQLAASIDSTYVGASDVHDDASCPFGSKAWHSCSP